MTKLRELKFKHAEGTGGFTNNGNNSTSFTTSITNPDDALDGSSPISLV